MDEESTRAISRGKYYQSKADKVGKKYNKLMSKTKNASGRKADKAKKLRNEYNEYTKTSKKYYDDSKKIDSETWKVMAKAYESGLSITSSHVNRNAMKGKMFLASMTGGIPLSAALMASEKNRMDSNTVVGQKYKVR